MSAKRDRLRAMRILATGLLAAMAVLLGISSYFEPRHPALAWLRAFTEAALVGGLADWFAVVALFRHPLGVLFPHTAIVPRNKDRIGVELGEFVERNFLTPENIVARLRGADLAGNAARWLALPENAAQVASAMRGFVPRILAAMDDSEIEGMISRGVAARLDRLDMAAVSGGLLKVLTEDGRHQILLDQTLSATGRWLDINRSAIRGRFGTRSKMTPKWLDSYVVNRFIDSVIDLVDEVVAAPRHELRESFDRYVQDLIERLATDPDLQRKAADLKSLVLEHLAPERLVGGIWAEIKRRLTEDDGTVEARIAASVAHLARDVQQDEALLGRLNAGVIAVIEIGLGRFRRQFSTLIADVVRRWDADDVSRKIELEVGSDLQFIRLNGTLVGGAAGLVIHAVLMLLG